MSGLQLWGTHLCLEGGDVLLQVALGLLLLLQLLPDGVFLILHLLQLRAQAQFLPVLLLQLLLWAAKMGVQEWGSGSTRDSG